MVRRGGTRRGGGRGGRTRWERGRTEKLMSKVKERVSKNPLPLLGGRRYVASTPKGVGGDVGMRGGPHMGRGAKGYAFGARGT